MSRPFHPLTIKVLSLLNSKPKMGYPELHKRICPEKPYKYFYNIMYRLEMEGLTKKTDDEGLLMAAITEDGKTLVMRKLPERDGIWKLVIFDIPEKHKYVRNVLRAKLKSLLFKKWQNSIWASPYALDAELEEEMRQLSKKFFVRLIKTTDINETEDLKKLFD